MSKLRTIQALRAIAAIAVMFAHLYGIEARTNEAGPLLSPLVLAGMSGVDLFFVISGFVMVWVSGDLERGPRTSLSFFYARVTRIYPTWWLFAGVFAAYFYITLGVPWDPEQLAKTGASGPEHLFKSAFLLPQPNLPVLQLGWTLVHEMYFYVVFAGLLLLPRAWRLPAMLVWAGIIIASMLIGRATFHGLTPVSLVLHPMTLEFLMGAGIGFLVRARITSLALPALLIGLAGAFYAIINVDITSLAPTFPIQRMLFFGIPAALIVYGLVALETRSEFGKRVPGFLVRIGDWSYSLYLGHLIVIAAVARLYDAMLGHDSVAVQAGYLIVASLTAIAVAGLTYHLFERPSMRFLRRWQPDPKSSPANISAASAE